VRATLGWLFFRRETRRNAEGDLGRRGQRMIIGRLISS
jgi:hypothetical protein